MKNSCFSRSICQQGANHFLLIITFFCLSIIKYPVLAQGALEEIVVTARKKEENLQESPIAITAFSSERLQEAGIKNLADFNTVVPNVDVGDGNGNAGVANIFIRGVGQRNTEPNVDSGVATYIDGVYIGRADGALLDVYDLQSVQILRGPQGTLFGKNATGGALVFTSNRPKSEYEIEMMVQAGSYQTKNFQGYVNIPIVDNSLYTRLSVVSKKRDGYIYNVTDGNYYNDIDRLSAIWQTRWLFNDDITIDFNSNYGKTAQTTRLQKCIVVDEAIDGAWQRISSDSSVNSAYNKSIIDFCKESQNLNTYESASDLKGGYDAENQGFSTTVEWLVNDFTHFKSITAWRGTKASQDDDVDSIAIPLLHRSNSIHPFATQRETNQYSQEFQLSGELFDSTTQYVVGVYILRETTDGGIITNQAGPIKSLPPQNDHYFYTTYATHLDIDNKAYSAFSQIDWNFSNGWVLTTGLRYTQESRGLTKTVYAADESTFGVNGATLVGYLQGALLQMSAPNSFNYFHNYILDSKKPRVSDKISKDAWTPMASIKYSLPENRFINQGSAYLTFSKGFRSGGLSEAPGNSLEEFKPEKVTNIELGVKMDAWNNRLRLNASAFKMDYIDRQLTTIVFDYVSGIPAPATINAERSSISGIEIETTIFPIQSLQVSFNGTWNRGVIDKFEDIQIQASQIGDVTPPNCTQDTVVIVPINICNIDRSDENLPRLPKRSFMLSLEYQLNTPYGMVIPRLQGAWKYDIDNCFDRSSCESGLWYSEEQVDISARLSWFSPKKNWRVSVFGSNLSKDEYSNGGTALSDALGYGGQTYNTPRMIGIEAQYTY